MQWNDGDALAALGIVQMGARLYDPVIGRFNGAILSPIQSAVVKEIIPDWTIK